MPPRDLTPAAPQWVDQPRPLVSVRQMPMVDWYAPSQLASTAVKAVLSGVFGRFVDRRELEALDGRVNDVHNYSRQQQITIDYLADTGDGWNSTYSIASLLAAPALSVKLPTSQPPLALPMADVVILGGDQVYPTPSRREYEDRLVAPFETAKAWSPETTAPALYALPGNHDWYDGLVSFMRLFLNKGWFAGWRTWQTRSYFALKLPHRWWLVGVDIQLDSDIDMDQLEYFKWIANEQMQAGDSLILCVAEPEWVYQGERDCGHWDALPKTAPQRNCPPPYASNLEFLEKRVFERVRTRVVLAGDLHHYRRHARADGAQKITSGGGGAFLHPTHGLSQQPLEGGFAPQASSWPPTDVSRRLPLGNLKLSWNHPRFASLIACTYVVLGWTVFADLHQIPFEWRNAGLAASEVLQKTLNSPGAFGVALLVFFGFYSFADGKRRTFRWVAGSVHGGLHLALCLTLGWAAVRATDHWGLAFGRPPQLLAAAGLIAAGGFVLGTTLFGFYLLVCSWLGRHGNESFSSVAAEDWKHFLRLQIGTDGRLTIFPIGLRKVPRAWKETASNDPSQPRLEPDGASLDPELIETPISVSP